MTSDGPAARAPSQSRFARPDGRFALRARSVTTVSAMKHLHGGGFLARATRVLGVKRSRRRAVASLSALVFFALALFCLHFFMHAAATGPGGGAVLRDAATAVVGNASLAVGVATPVEMTPMQIAREQYGRGNMSALVLFHNEYDSLKHSLESWVSGGLVDYVDEIIFFLNGVKSEHAFLLKAPEVASSIPQHKRRIVPSPRNLPLGLAITRMVSMASSEYVLLLEKDWKLIESREVMESRLTDSKVLVGSGAAHLVRHRHRHNPGVPLHALIMHDGREEAIMRVQKNLLCNTHHWQKDPTAMYPGSGIIYRCGGAQNNLEEEDVYCAPSEFCQWTNNPGVFNKTWFVEEVGKMYLFQYEIEHSKYGPTSPFLDFEYYTNWRPYAWTDKNFTVAFGVGLFSHAESEHVQFNTFWYAHYRLTVDLEEIRDQYLKNETRFKELGGVHYDPASPIPPTMMERYPVEFARKYHWSQTFTGNYETQRKMIDERYQQYVSRYRVLDVHDYERSGGASAGKVQKKVDWRGEITAMHSVVEKAMMIAPPVQPFEMNITLVTSLLDIGRSALDDDAFKFRREMQMYMEAMADWLTHDYNKVVYTSKDVADELLKTASDKVKATTKFVYTTREELRSKWIGPDNYDKIQKIRKSDEWLNRASWLSNSPQAGLADYNPLVMAKMFMMRDAARQNHWDTTHFVFIDAKHNCRNPKLLTPKNDHILRAHMFDKLLLTEFDYTPATEVHGFEFSAFNGYINMKDATRPQLVKIGRGGIFGGSPFVLEYIAAMYDVALTATLREGLMGTEENILSIVRYQVPQYVDPFSNNWACPATIAKDHTCAHIKTQGYNCAIFEWAARNAVMPTSDDSGQR